MGKKRPNYLVGQSVRGHASIRLEQEFWMAVDEICSLEHLEYEELVRRIALAGPRKGLTSAIRVFVLQHVRRRERATAQREVLRLIRPQSDCS